MLGCHTQKKRRTMTIDSVVVLHLLKQEIYKQTYILPKKIIHDEVMFDKESFFGNIFIRTSPQKT